VDEPVKTDTLRKEDRSKNVFQWFDRRTGLGKMMRTSLDEPIPGGARWAYIFGSGLLFIFISQVITGLCLALYYVPSAETAHTSVAYITKQVAAGAFLRSLHTYGSSAMIVVLLLHFLQTFLYGSFKGRRELLWISGATLSLLVLAMGFTGHLLPWDQDAYFATAVGTNLAGQVPIIGQWMIEMMRGGDTIGTLTLSRFYFAHVFLIPGMIFLLVGIHIVLFRKAGPAGPIKEDALHPKLPPAPFYPRQVLMDMGFALLLMAGLGIFAYFRPVGLGPIADPASTQFLPRPEWYYLPMFEWLKFWEGPEVVFAIVVVPGILALLFFLLPFLDRNLERKPWRRPIPLLGVSIVLVGTLFLGIKSEVDDAHDPSIAAQLAIQAQQERAYTEAPFHPDVESPGGTGSMPTGPVDPVVAQGKGIFTSHGCSGCHGENGAGAVAVSLVGVTRKFSDAQLIELLHNPNAQMHAGGMPAVNLSASDMTALLKYLSALGTDAANVPAATGAPTSGGAATPPAATPPAATPPAAATPASTKPAPAKPGASSAAAQAGEKIFQAHGCSACHGPAGAGTAIAPPLAGLVAGLSDQQLSKLLHHPNAKMSAGGMPAFTGSPKQESSLIAYIHSLGTAPAGGAAPAAKAGARPASTKPPSAEVLRGKKIFQRASCESCHGVGGLHGTVAAPGLAGTASLLPASTLENLLRHHSAQMQNGGMPLTNMNAPDMKAIVAYIRSMPAHETRQ